MSKSISLKDISQYLNSQRFAHILSKLEHEQSSNNNSGSTGVTIESEMMGIAIEYVEAFGKSGNATLEEMEEILNLVVKKKNNNQTYDIGDAFKNKILRDLQLKDKELNEEDMEIAKMKVIEIFGYRGATKYHGFNGAIKEKIKQEGLDPNKKLNMNDVNIIYELYRKYGLTGAKMAYEKDNNMIYYSHTATVSYDYALQSPEWMARICGEENFENRDYEASKEEILRMIKQKNFSQEDADLFLNAFESCWKTFAVSNNPCVVAIPNEISHNEIHNDILRAKFADLDFEKTFSILFSAKNFVPNFKDLFSVWGILDKVSEVLGDDRNNYVSNHAFNNENTYDKIETDEAVFIDLPPLKELQRKIEIEKQSKNEEGFEQ